MPVPVTVLSIREQIRQGIQLVLEAYGTNVPTFSEYSYYKSETEYPLIKVYYPNTDNLGVEYFNGADRRQSILYVEVTPWGDTTDIEYKTSQIIEKWCKYVNTDSVKAQLDSAYKSKLGKITCTQAQLIGTSLKNPPVAVQFSFTIDYLVN